MLPVIRSAPVRVVLLLLLIFTGGASVVTLGAVQNRTESLRSMPVVSQSTPSSASLVISQVYGGGGSSAITTYCYDFIELFNPTSGSVTTSGMSIQYAASTGNFTSNFAMPNATIPAGKYYLIQTGNTSTGACSALPTPDAITSINLASASGKVGLLNTLTAQVCGASGNRCTTNPAFSQYIIDYVGYGTAATDYEGLGPVANLSTTMAAARNGAGCTDTDNNVSDFTVVSGSAITPRNNATAANTCAVATSTPTMVGATNTAVAPTDTAVPPTSTNTAVPTATVMDTALPSATATATPIPASATNTLSPTATSTAVPPTVTNTPIPPSTTGTSTPVPPTGTNTPVPPTATSSATTVPSNTATSTSTSTTQPTNTYTPIPPTGTSTAVPPSFTSTTTPTITATATATNTPGPNHGSLVISQVYGGGGSSAATTYCYDFIELFNPTSAPITTNGWSVQYGSAPNNFSSIINLPLITIPSGGYYLIQTGSTTTGVCSALPQPDQISSANLAATAGKVALVNNQTLLACGATGNRCTTNPTYSPYLIDLVGYGATAADYEGLGPVGALSTTTSAERNGQGCVDTDNNLSDFTIMAGPAITPRNSMSPLHSCTTSSTPTPTAMPTDTQVVATATSTMIGTVTAQASATLTATTQTATSTVTVTRTSTALPSSTQTAIVGTSTATVIATGTATITTTATGTPAPGGTGLVISQVYGGGGSSGATTYCYDFIELFNPTSAPVTTNSWSVQYASATGNFSGIINLPNVTIPSGGYYLIQTGSTTTGTCSALPSPDLTATVNLSATNGKVALVNIQTLLACGAAGNQCTTNPGFGQYLVDFVGYGTATDFEGLGPVAPLSTTTSAERNGQGCIDTNNNVGDFTIMAGPAITPRNSISPLHSCNGSPTVTRTITASATVAASATTTALISPTATRTQTATLTPVFTATATSTRTATASVTPTGVSPATLTSTQTAVPTSTVVPPSTATSTALVTATGTSTGVATSTPTLSLTATQTILPATSTPSQTAGITSTASPTAMPTLTMVPTAPATATQVETAQVTSTAVSTTTSTMTATPAGTATACSVQFTDVPQGSTFYPFIRCLACRGVISGYPDGTFRPFNRITRGQIAKMVANAAGIADDPGAQIFEDVSMTDPFYTWINRLSRRGYMGGYPCGSVLEEPCILPGDRPYFRTYNAATRGQLAKIVSNAAGFNDVPSGVFYTDVQEDHPFYVWIMRLTSRGVMSGYPCGGPNEPCDDQRRPYFRPYSEVTRGQAAKIVANSFFPDCQTPVR